MELRKPIRPSMWWLAFSLLALGGVLTLPSGIGAWFDGLPWSGALETVLLTVGLPFLLLVGWRFLFMPSAAWGLGILLCLKLVLALSAPPSGWELRVYASPEAMERGEWERTYTTVWREGISEVLDHPLKELRDFPVEWMNRDGKLLRRFWLGVELRGFARLPQDAGLALVAAGLKGDSIVATDESGRKWNIPVVEDMGQAARLPNRNLPRGNLRIQGSLRYEGGYLRFRPETVHREEKWSLVPILVQPDGRVEPAFKRAALWRTEAGLALSSFQLRAYKALASVVDFGLLFFVAAWAVWSAWRLIRERVLDVGLLLLSGFCLALAWWLPELIHDSGTVRIAAAVAIVGAGLVSWAFMKEKSWERRVSRLGLVVLLVVGPAILSYFLIKWWPQVGRMEFFSVGDDWRTYQNFGRQIVVEGDWWHHKGLQGAIFYYQPLYRYVVGILHLFFGQSPLAQQLLDVWSIVGAASILASMGHRLGLFPAFALMGPWLYLGSALAGSFRHIIGRGLQENPAMLFLMLAAWFAVRSRAKKLSLAMVAGLLAVVGYWFRQDHLGVLAGVGLLALEPILGGLPAVWRGWLGAIRQHWKWLVVYLGILGLGPLLVTFRNWVFGGQFVLTSNLPHVLITDFSQSFQNVLVLLNAHRSIPNFTALILWPGTLLAIAALVWRRGPLARYPLGLGLALASLVAPYFFLVADVYIPRFSVHLLPLATLSLVIVLNWMWYIVRARPGAT